MSKEQVLLEIQNGGRFVSYMYCLSLVVTTIQMTPPRLIRPAESRIVGGWPYNLLTFVAGWWSVPTGPMATVAAIAKNFKGGVDNTEKVKAALESNWPIIYL